MTLAQLAGIVGVSIPHMSEVERGLKNVNNHLLTRTAEALGVAPRDLIGGDVDQDVAELAATFARLSEADRARVRAFVDGLLATRLTP